MPMIDVYASEGTFPDPHDLARDLAAAVMRWERVPDLGVVPGEHGGVHPRTSSYSYLECRWREQLHPGPGAGPDRRLGPRETAWGGQGANRDRRQRKRGPECGPSDLGADNRIARRRLGHRWARQHGCGHR